jgi:hypothetical protein
MSTPHLVHQTLLIRDGARAQISELELECLLVTRRTLLILYAVVSLSERVLCLSEAWTHAHSPPSNIVCDYNRASQQTRICWYKEARDSELFAKAK